MVANPFENAKVAVVHDWLTGMRGGEVVLEAILDLFPQADLYTLLHDKGKLSAKIENRQIHTSFIQKLPLSSKLYRHYLPLFPVAIEEFDFHGYDLVFSSSHCVAKGVIVPPGIFHICFVHSPMRYVWDMYRQYFPGNSLLQKFIIPFFANQLRTWDAASAHRVDRYLSNSSFVKERIRRFYGRDANVVFPPCIDSARIHTGDSVIRPADRKNYVVFSALVPYKRIDIAVEAFNANGLPLIIAGDGPELKKLQKSAGPNITFTGRISREQSAELLKNAKGLIFPGVEDFGIIPVEAQSHGCPVVAYARGGALETVNEKTGTFFYSQDADSLSEAVHRHEKKSFRRSDLEKNLKQFTKQSFHDSVCRELGKLRGGDSPQSRRGKKQ